MKTIVTIKHGSHLYGTNTPDSDLDFKSVHIPDARDILLQRAGKSITTGRKKPAGEKNLPSDVDHESYSLQYFMTLAAKGDSVVMDLIFAPKEMIIGRATQEWNWIQMNRHRFFSKGIVAYVEYCKSQANKYGIKGSRMHAAKNTAVAFQGALLARPNTKVAELGFLLDALVETNPDHVKIVEKTINGHPESYFECCGRQVPFNASVRLAAEMYQRLFHEYGERARQAEANQGIDWKAISHAIRVAYQALDLLGSGEVVFPLRQAPHLLEVKQGKLSYREVAAELETLIELLTAAQLASSLPETPDLQFMEDMVLDCYNSAMHSF